MKKSALARKVFLLFILVPLAWSGSGTPDRSVTAVWYNSPPAASGFPVNLSGGAIYESSPVLADLNGDGAKDVVIGGPDAQNGCRGRLYAVGSKGDVLWDIRTRAPINSTPAVANIDDDPALEVVVGLGTAESKDCADGGVLAIRALTGEREWVFDTQDWTDHVHNGFTDGVFSSPGIADFDNDGSKEIVFGSFDQCIYMVDGQGNPLWTWDDPNRCGGHGYYNQDTIWSSPAIADLNGDGDLEMVIGADISEGNRSGDPTGGYLYVFAPDGRVLARRWFDQAIYSSPAVGDIDGDWDLEIVVGTGTWVPGTGYYVTAWDFVPNDEQRGTLQREYWWATSGRVFSSPALADLNGNGGLDVIAIASVGDGPWNGGEDNGSKVVAWDGKTGKKLFETMVCDSFGNAFNVHSSPTVADIDGDGRLEILFGHAWEVTVLNDDGTYYTDYSSSSVNDPVCRRTHEPTTDLTFWARYSVYGTPAVGDLSGDGGLEVVVGGGDDPTDQTVVPGMLYAWQPERASATASWPMFNRDPAHTSFYPRRPRLSATPLSLYALQQVGEADSVHLTLHIQNTGDQTFDWSGVAPSGVTLTPSHGTVEDDERVMVTVSTQEYAAGMHRLGDITIRGSTEDDAVMNSPSSIPVTLYVGDLYEAFLPIAVR